MKSKFVSLWDALAIPDPAESAARADIPFGSTGRFAGCAGISASAMPAAGSFHPVKAERAGSRVGNRITVD